MIRENRQLETVERFRVIGTRNSKRRRSDRWHNASKYAFIKTYKPVMDDAQYRSFETTAEYREWCEKNLPSCGVWLLIAIQ